MQTWTKWIIDKQLQAVSDYIINGGVLDQDNANHALDLLSKESNTHIQKLVGQKKYLSYFPTNRHGKHWMKLQPSGVVDHYTTGIKAKTTLMWFSKRPRKNGGSSSAHYVADRDGTFIQLIDPRVHRALHARKANATHVGIEHVNTGPIIVDGDKLYFQRKSKHCRYPSKRVALLQEIEGELWEPYTTKQIVFNIVIKRILIAALPTLISDEFVDHAKIYKYKRDCGPLFPLKAINKLSWNSRPLRNLESLRGKYLTMNLMRFFEEETNAM